MIIIEKKFLNSTGLLHFYDKIDAKYVDGDVFTSAIDVINDELVNKVNDEDIASLSNQEIDEIVEASQISEYDSTKTYSVGDFCFYNEILYCCIADISSPEAWNSNHWEEATESSTLVELIDLIQDANAEISDLKETLSQLGTDLTGEINAIGNLESSEEFQFTLERGALNSSGQDISDSPSTPGDGYYYNSSCRTAGYINLKDASSINLVLVRSSGATTGNYYTYICFYSENYSFISREGGINTAEISNVEVPANAKYFRVTLTMTRIDHVEELHITDSASTDNYEIVEKVLSHDEVIESLIANNIEQKVSDHDEAIASMITDECVIKNISFYQKAISEDGTDAGDSSIRISCDYLDVNLYPKIVVKAQGLKIRVFYYDKDKVCKGYKGYTLDEVILRNYDLSTKYVRITLSKNDDTQGILPSDASALTLTKYGINALGSYNNPFDLESGAINAQGAKLDMNSRIRSKEAIRITTESIITIDPAYEIFTAIFSESEIGSASFIEFITWSKGHVDVSEYLGKYVGISIRKIGHLNDDISGDVLLTDAKIVGIENRDGANAPTPYLYQKTGIILGDSISYGLYSYWNGSDRYNSDGLSPDFAPKRISDYFADLAGMEIDNIARRGTGYVADSRSLGNALVKARATDFSEYNFVGLCFGINDYIQNKTLGSISQGTEGTVVGNLMLVLQKIYSDNPLAKVVIFSPYNAWGQVAVNQGANSLYGDFASNYALGYQNSAGYTLQDLVDAIDEVSDYYGVTHERLNKSNVVNRLNIKDIMVDGLHPTLESLPLLAAEMFAQKDFG